MSATVADEVVASSMTEANPESAIDGNTLIASAGSSPRRRRRVLAYRLLPALILILALVAGYAKWSLDSNQFSSADADNAVQSATNATARLLSYQHDNVEHELTAATDGLTGEFRDAYTSLINEVVIPGAREQRISAVAGVTAAAPVSVSDGRAVVLLFVNQTTTIGDGAPTNTSSSVRVTLQRSDVGWLISHFEPI